MPWLAIVETNTALARIIGVSQPAIVQAERRGKIEREDDGTWDVYRVVESWRDSTMPTLQRAAGSFRPWLDAETPLSACIWRELERRARAEGADIVWQDDDEEDGDGAPGSAP